MFKDKISIFVGLFFLVGIMSTVSLISFLIDRVSCYSQASAMEITDIRQGPLIGCIVKYHGEWIPLKHVGTKIEIK